MPGIQVQPCCCEEAPPGLECIACDTILSPPPAEAEIRLDGAFTCPIHGTYALPLVGDWDPPWTPGTTACAYYDVFDIAGNPLTLAMTIAGNSGSIPGRQSIHLYLCYGESLTLTDIENDYAAPDAHLLVDNTLILEGGDSEDFCTGTEFLLENAQLFGNATHPTGNCHIMTEDCCSFSDFIDVYGRIPVADEGIPHLLAGGAPNVAAFIPPPQAF